MLVRGLFAALSTIVLLATPLAAQPSTYPSRTVTLVVPFAAGGGIDTIARIVADKLKDRLGQPVVVENKTGAGGLLAAQHVASSPPDGHTLLLSTAVEPLIKLLRSNVAFDSVKDLTYVAEIARAPLVFLVSPTLPVKTIGEFVAYAKANPGKLSYGTPGVGTPMHLAGELFRTSAALDLVHVPYKGVPPGLNDLMTDRIAAFYGTTVVTMPLLEAGKLRVLATAEEKRSPILPDVPTLAEAGFPVVVPNWYGIAAAAGTPGPIVARINRELREIASLADTQQRFSTLGLSLAVSSPDELRQVVVGAQENYGASIAKVGFKAE